jgi:hypothetical protein
VFAHGPRCHESELVRNRREKSVHASILGRIVSVQSYGNLISDVEDAQVEDRVVGDD